MLESITAVVFCSKSITCCDLCTNAIHHCSLGDTGTKIWWVELQWARMHPNQYMGYAFSHTSMCYIEYLMMNRAQIQNDLLCYCVIGICVNSIRIAVIKYHLIKKKINISCPCANMKRNNLNSNNDNITLSLFKPILGMFIYSVSLWNNQWILR